MTTKIYLTEVFDELENPFDLKRGCTSFDDSDLPVLQEFETWEQGLNVLTSKTSSVRKNSGAAGTFFSVHEYWLDIFFLVKCHIHHLYAITTCSPLSNSSCSLMYASASA